MSEFRSSKADLRRELRGRRHALDISGQTAAAAGLARQVDGLPAWQPSRHIALYLDADGEIGTAELARCARSADKLLYLPVIDDRQHLHFALWQEGDPLAVNRFGIGEPAPDAPRLAATSLDILFLPLVGWDLAGGRLGMGGGFYDRSLEKVSGPLLVGLAHDCQRLDRVPMAGWDKKLDFVATGTALHDCRVT